MRNNKIEILKNLVLVTQLGISVSLPIIAGVYIGAYLDNKFGTAPIFLIVCLIMFSIGGFANVFKMVGFKKKKTDEEDLR